MGLEGSAIASVITSYSTVAAYALVIARYAPGIIGDWPTLRGDALFENRDTRPTLDMRGLFKGVLADHLGVDRAALDSTVFPDSAGVRAVAGVV